MTHHMTATQIAGAVGVPRHRIRYLLKAWSLPASGELAGTKTYHPGILAWVRAYIEEERVVRDRHLARRATVLSLIQQDEATETATIDFELPKLVNA